MREIDDKTLKELVNYSKEYFKNIDPSFFGGLADLLSNIGEKLQTYATKSRFENFGHSSRFL